MSQLKRTYPLSAPRWFSPRWPSEGLIAWMRDPGEPEGAPLSLGNWREHPPAGVPKDEWVEVADISFFQEIQGASRRGAKPIAIVDTELKPTIPHHIDGSNLPEEYIHSLIIQVPIRLTLRSISVKNLLLNAASDLELRILDCNLRLLSIGQNNANAVVRLNRTNVGTLQIRPGTLRHLEMRGGRLLNIDCPAPATGNPFTGAVSFDSDVYFPRRRYIHILTSAQPYRNMRTHLRALENTQMANLMHSAELAVERDDDPLVTRILSHLYEWMSDFGSSPLRPLGWMLMLFLLSFLLILGSDGAVYPSKDSTQELFGWQRIFLDPRWGDYSRAAYLAVQPLVNPIGIFGPKPLLIPGSVWLAVWLSLDGILGIFLLALFIFAIRRRFKIQG